VNFPRQKEGDKLCGEVITMDHFGNVITSLRCDSSISAKAEYNNCYFFPADNYQSVPKGEVGLIRGSAGFWELAAKENSAAKLLKVKKGDKIFLTRN